MTLKVLNKIFQRDKIVAVHVKIHSIQMNITYCSKPYYNIIK